MSTFHNGSHGRIRRVLPVAVAAVLALSTGACAKGNSASSSNSSTGAAAVASPGAGTGGNAGTSSSSAGTSNSGGTSNPLNGFTAVPVPGPPLKASSLKGKVVYWIPISSSPPIFGVEQAAATQAFESAGIKLQLCDGAGSPAAVDACVKQAVAAKAGGIIVTSIPPEFAQNSFAAAVAAKVPVEFVNTKDATVPAAWTGYAAALPSNFVQQAEVNNDLIIKDSGGKADVLMVEVTDSSVTTHAYDVGMKGYLGAHCPGCSINTVQGNITTISNLPAQVKAALVKNPNTNYVFVEFDSWAPGVVQALRELNKTSSIKLVTMLGQLDGMQRIASGSAFADTGYSIAALGWNEADVMMRLMLHQDPLPGAHRTPIKSYTAANIKGVDLSSAGWLSGKWSSDDDFRAMFRKLWGV